MNICGNGQWEGATPMKQQRTESKRALSAHSTRVRRLCFYNHLLISCWSSCPRRRHIVGQGGFVSWCRTWGSLAIERSIGIGSQRWTGNLLTLERRAWHPMLSLTPARESGHLHPVLPLYFSLTTGVWNPWRLLLSLLSHSAILKSVRFINVCLFIFTSLYWFRIMSLR